MLPTVYLVGACECDENGDCIGEQALETKTSNSMINICVYLPNSNNIVVLSEIKDMEIFSNTLVYKIITDSAANDITVTKIINGGKKEMISTRLVGAFFTSLEEGVTSSVNIIGTVVMEFSASSSVEPGVRKLVTVGSVRQNTEDSGTKYTHSFNTERGLERTDSAGLGEFGVEVEISKSVEDLVVAPTSDAITDGVLSIVLSLIIGGGVFLALL